MYTCVNTHKNNKNNDDDDKDNNNNVKFKFLNPETLGLSIHMSFQFISSLGTVFHL